jgi:hypothetical protein
MLLKRQGVKAHFSPRVWKGEASVPPLQGPPDYSCDPCPAQLAADLLGVIQKPANASLTMP